MIERCRFQELYKPFSTQDNTEPAESSDHEADTTTESEHDPVSVNGCKFKSQ